MTKRDPVTPRDPNVCGTPRDPVTHPLRGVTRGTRSEHPQTVTPADLTYNHPRHPAWLRCWLYAMDHDGRDLDPGELRDAIGTDARTLSRGLRQARVMGLLTEDSHARHLAVRHLPLGRQVAGA